MRTGVLGIFSLGLLLMAPLAMAAPVTEQQVITAVETWLKFGLTDNRPDASVARLEPHQVDGRIVAFIAHLRDGGYCLCGSDDVLLPINFYVPVGEYDPDNEELKGILEGLAARLQWVEEARSTGDKRLDPYRNKLTERAQEWRDLASGIAIRRESESRDVPATLRLPLNSEWFQGWPYNQFCPPVPDGSQTIVGCVATAMAQIMYYWQWPETGYSANSVDYSYRHTDTWISTPQAVNPHITQQRWVNRMSWTSADGGQLQINGSWDTTTYNRAASDFGLAPGFIAALDNLYAQLTPETTHHYANFAGTSYNFELMEDIPVDPNGPGAEAAALLSYHAGIAVDMNWGLFESGAVTANSATAYENHFRYDPDTVYDLLDTDLIMEEIQWQRPVHIRGETITGGGHSWVLSGYDNGTPGETYFWMNLGWGANDIGWYRFDTVPLGFWFDHAQITGIAPNSVVRFMGNPFVDPAADGSPSNPYNDPHASQIEMPDGGTLIIKTGHNVMWSGGGVMSRPMIVKGIGSTISYAP